MREDARVFIQELKTSINKKVFSPQIWMILLFMSSILQVLQIQFRHLLPFMRRPPGYQVIIRTFLLFQMYIPTNIRMITWSRAASSSRVMDVEIGFAKRAGRRTWRAKLSATSRPSTWTWPFTAPTATTPTATRRRGRRTSATSTASSWGARRSEKWRSCKTARSFDRSSSAVKKTLSYLGVISI